MADETTYQPTTTMEIEERGLPPAITNAAQPLVDKAKAFFKAQPFATAALVGVLGIATINTLRGKR